MSSLAIKLEYVLLLDVFAIIVLSVLYQLICPGLARNLL